MEEVEANRSGNKCTDAEFYGSDKISFLEVGRHLELNFVVLSYFKMCARLTD